MQGRLKWIGNCFTSPYCVTGVTPAWIFYGEPVLMSLVQVV